MLLNDINLIKVDSSYYPLFEICSAGAMVENNSV